MIKLVALDIDGVLTDGSVMIDSDGKEHKQVSLKDIDAVFELHRRGFQLAAVTGEDTYIVGYFEKRFPWDFFIRGNKKKKEALQKTITKLQMDNNEKNTFYEKLLSADGEEYRKIAEQMPVPQIAKERLFEIRS